MKTNFNDFVDSDIPKDFFVIYDKDMVVCHLTSKSVADKIRKEGFKTGEELDISEKRKAVYFSDKTVNYGLYARNKEGELYEGEDIGEVCVNIKGIKLLNMNFKANGKYTNYNLFKNFVVKGELDEIPYDIDGTISYLNDGRIYEVALKKEIANKILK